SRREERDPDRRVRLAEAPRRAVALGRGDGSRAAALPADPDDLARLHPRGRAARLLARRRRRRARRGRHRRDGRHAGGDFPRHLLRADVLQAHHRPPSDRAARDGGDPRRSRSPQGGGAAEDRPSASRAPRRRTAAMIRYLPALLAVVLAGCTTVGPDYKRPQIDTPRAWPDQTAAPAKVPDRWWTLYGDAVLDALVDEALRHNTDIAQAVARVDEARAQLKSVDADRYPRVGANASAYRYRASEKSALWFPGFNPYYRDYAAELTASWEIDLWGRVRRATEAARADVATAEAD